MEFVLYWRSVWSRAWRDTWSVIIQHSWKTLARDGAILAIAIAVLVIAEQFLVTRGWMSTDNTKDTFAWMVLTLIAAVGAFFAWFFIEGLVFVHYKMSREGAHTEAVGREWVTIKQAVDYIRNESGWTTDAVGVAWSDDLDRCMREAFVTRRGPEVKGCRYPIGTDSRQYEPPKLQRVPRRFWSKAKFDVDQIRKTPARIVASSKDIFFDNIVIRREALERAFPRKRLPPVPRVTAKQFHFEAGGTAVGI